MRWMLGSSLVSVLLALVGGSALGQDGEPPREAGQPIVVVDPNGTDVFRDLLVDAGFRPQRVIEEALQDPSHTLIIALGDLTVFQQHAASLPRFLNGGGALLLATDSPYSDPVLGFEISGKYVHTPEREHSYRGDGHCPIVQSYGDPGLGQGVPYHIFHNVGPPMAPLATNNPSAVRRIAQLGGMKFGDTLAGYPPSARFVDGSKLVPGVDYFAFGGLIGRGHFLVLADHSVFINRMMAQSKRDNSNVEFARNCLDWLQSSGDQPRTRCLFLEDGTIRTQFALPTPSVPEKPMPPLDVLINTFLQHGNNLIAELQGRDAFNTALLSNFSLSAIVRTILLGLTAILLVVGLLRLWSARTGPDPAAQLTAQAAPLIPRGSAVRQRHAAQLEQGNLYELARQRVRDQFQFLDDIDWNGAKRPPNVVVEWHVPDRRRLRKRVERLWQIGYGSKPVRVPRREWDSFDADLDNVVRAAQDGWWRFEPPSGTTGRCCTVAPRPLVEAVGRPTRGASPQREV
jgi:Domain of unknown function (DUF4350)